MSTPEVIITGSTQATVEVSATNPAVVEVVAPAVPRMVEISVPGPQGPTRQPDEIRIDAATLGMIYAGRAGNGSTESSAVWTITRTTYNAAGIRTAKGVATNVTWTGRAGHTYS